MPPSITCQPIDYLMASGEIENKNRIISKIKNVPPFVARTVEVPCPPMWELPTAGFFAPVGFRMVSSSPKTCVCFHFPSYCSAGCPDPYLKSETTNFFHFAFEDIGVLFTFELSSRSECQTRPSGKDQSDPVDTARG